VKRVDAARFVQEAWDVLEMHIGEKGWGIFEDTLGIGSSDDDDDAPSWDLGDSLLDDDQGDL
jgi:hypothetical protein